MDRLTDLLHGVAAEVPAPVDFQTELVRRPSGPVSAVLGFTGHHLVAADVDLSWLDGARDANDFASVMRAPFLARLGQHLGAQVGFLDVVLVHPAADTQSGGASVDLVEVEPGSVEHLRLARALRYRRDVRAYRTRDGAGLAVVGRGLAGRYELSFEVEPVARGHGLGRALAAAGRRLVPADEPVWAQVSPGNAASLRVLLAAGYRPVGSEVLLHHGTA